jgi:hypothetical protein
MRREELRHAEAARAIAEARSPYSFNWCWNVSEAQLRYDRAVYHAACAERGAMLDAMRQAVAYGWRELPLVQVEPAFEFCRGDAELDRLLDEARRAPPLPV